MCAAHHGNFAPKDKVKITTLGCFQYKIGYIKEYLGMSGEEFVFDGVAYGVYARYKVTVGGYELTFYSHELQLV